MHKLRMAEGLRFSADWWRDSARSKMDDYAQGTPESYAQQIGSSVGMSVAAAPYALAGEGAALTMFALSANGGYQDMVDTGTPIPMAAALSTSNSIMEGLTEKIGVSQLFNGSAPVIKKAAKFAFGDLLGEEINTLYNDAVSKITVTPDMTMADVVQSVIDTAIVTAVAGPVQGVTMSGAAKASESILSSFDRRQQANAQHDFLIALGDTARSSKTYARLPEKVQDLVREAKADGPITDVYVPVEDFNELFQAEGLNPSEQAMQILSDPSRYEEAVATGGDIAIPLEDYAKLADSPFYAELARSSKTQLGGMSQKEVEAFEADPESAIAQLTELAIQPEDNSSQVYQQVYQQIFEDTQGQLLAVGQTADVAKANAEVRAKGLSTLAQRYGYDAQDLIDRFPVKITSGQEQTIASGPFVGKTYTEVYGEAQAWVDEQNATLGLSSSEQQFREAASIDAADIESNAANAEKLVIDGHRKDATVSANSLAHKWYLDAGYPVTQVVATLNGIASGTQLTEQQQEVAATWVESQRDLQEKFLSAVTAGELKEGDEFTAMIDDKLDDFTVIKVDEASGDVTVKDGVVKTLDFFDTVEIVGGVAGIATTEDVTPKTIDDYFSEQGVEAPQVLEQESVAFKSWFKDSQVVDEQGKPLVVYHGTHLEDMQEFDRDYAAQGVFWFSSDRAKIESGESGAASGCH